MYSLLKDCYKLDDPQPISWPWLMIGICNRPQIRRLEAVRYRSRK